MSLERKNSTQQLWKCSDLIWWWTSSLPLFKGWTSLFWCYVLVRQEIYRIFQSDLVALFALWVGFLSPNFLGDSNPHGETMPGIARDEFQQTNLSPNFPHWIYDNYWLKYWRHKSAVPTAFLMLLKRQVCQGSQLRTSKPTSVLRRWCCANSWLEIGLFFCWLIPFRPWSVLNFWVKIPSQKGWKFMWPPTKSLHLKEMVQIMKRKIKTWVPPGHGN